MGIRAEYRDGVFVPLQEVEPAIPDEVYQVFSESELRLRVAGVSWLKGVERSFEFWENEEDAVYDGLLAGRHRAGPPPHHLHNAARRGDRQRL